MRIHIPNSAFLGNIDPFLRSFDPSVPETLEITAHDKWIAVHPIVLSMIAALGLTVKADKISCEKFEAKSKHYLARMGLFDFLKIPSGISFVEHESAGRFIPLTRIRTSDELTKFIAEMIPLLHLEPEPSKTIGYIVSELVRKRSTNPMPPPRTWTPSGWRYGRASRGRPEGRAARNKTPGRGSFSSSPSRTSTGISS